MKHKGWNTDRFYFLKRTRRGLFVLLVLFIAIALFPRFYYNYFASRSHIYNIVLSEIPKENKQKNQEQKSYTIPKKKFNPNTYTPKQWEAIGLSKNEVSMITHYLEAGGQFKTKSDVKKIYSISPRLYKKLAPKIDLPNHLKKNKKENNDEKRNATKDDEDRWDKNTTNHFTVVKSVKINKATKEELLAIPGIGEYYANKIIILRKRFGGFIDIHQLMDLYKMDEEKLKALSPFLIIDKQDITKININTATVQRLRQHPWITSDMARSIVYYREHYEHYTRLDQLLLSPYIDAQKLKKIRPYLTVK